MERQHQDQEKLSPRRIAWSEHIIYLAPLATLVWIGLPIMALEIETRKEAELRYTQA